MHNDNTLKQNMIHESHKPFLPYYTRVEAVHTQVMNKKIHNVPIQVTRIKTDRVKAGSWMAISKSRKKLKLIWPKYHYRHYTINTIPYKIGLSHIITAAEFGRILPKKF